MRLSTEMRQKSMPKAEFRRRDLHVTRRLLSEAIATSGSTLSNDVEVVMYSSYILMPSCRINSFRFLFVPSYSSDSNTTRARSSVPTTIRGFRASNAE
ncbi:hypothetical protein D3C76_1455550 [compost metagenome]